MDLPGIYSLSPYTLEEVVARNYLITRQTRCDFKYVVHFTNIEKKPVSVHTDHGAYYSSCHGNQYDGSGSKERNKINVIQLSKLVCLVVEISALVWNQGKQQTRLLSLQRREH